MYVKLFGSILQSSIWQEDTATRLLWITMLALADEYGMVYASVPGLAHAANIERAACEQAIQILESPDPDSRDKGEAGRRIHAFEGGWEILNYRKYREIRTRRQIADAARQKRNRQQQRADGA